MSTAPVPAPIGGDPAKPWTRMKGETAAAYAAFVLYREQHPPRAVARVARALNRGKRTLDEWCAKYQWVERATAYTDHLAMLSEQAMEDEIVRRRREEAERLYGIGHDLQDKGHARLRSLVPEELDADETARFLDLGTKFVRLSMGLPTDYTGTITVSMTDVQRILGSFISIAERHMSPDAHEALVRECWAMVRETLGESR